MFDAALRSRLIAATGIAAAIVVMLALPVSARADAPKVLPGHIPAAVSTSSLVGRLAPSTQIGLAIVLSLRDEAGLDALLTRLYDPGDPAYGHFLTPQQFADTYGPTPAQYADVEAFAAGHGLSVTGTSGNRLVLDVSGPSSAVETAFGVHMDQFRDSSGRSFFAPDRDPVVPAEIAASIDNVAGFENATVRYPFAAGIPAELSPLAGKNSATGVGGGYAPSDIKKAYNVASTSATGAGQTLAVFELASYTASDVAGYESYYGLPSVPLTNVAVDGGTTSKSGADEVTLDIELQVAMAPGASGIRVYEAPNSDQGVIDCYNKIATDDLATSISTCWGLAETESSSSDLTSENTIFKTMAAQGQAIFAAAGDSGADDNGSSLSVDDPASQPYVVGVGGTSLTTTSTQAWSSETTWNDSSGAGGGGISSVWPIPSWQIGATATDTEFSSTSRDVPDVSLDADPDTGFSVYYEGKWWIYGGTSCAAPLWAGFDALVNQTREANGSANLGFPNPALYAIGEGADGKTDFHDIADNSTNGHYHAVPGYDLATGWGTIDGANLLADLAPSTPTAPTVPTGLKATAGNTTIALTWTSSIGATSYNVYRGTSSGGESTTPIATGVTSASYGDSGLTNGQTYYYKVAAVNGNGTSGLSNEASATPTLPPPPAAPTGLKATAGNATVSLSWTASSGATSYNVYRGTSSGGESTTPIATGVTSASYGDSGLTNGQTYYYKVAALNSSGTSGLSNEASATPVAATLAITGGPSGYLQGSTETVTWTTNLPATSVVHYGTSPSNLSNTLSNTSLVTSHSIAITGLTRKTYYITFTSTAGTQTVTSAVYEFTG